MKLFKDYLLRPQRRESPLLCEIRDTVRRIRHTYAWFNTESDADLIDSCVYQLESLESRYRYLIRLARDQQLLADELDLYSAD